MSETNTMNTKSLQTLTVLALGALALVISPNQIQAQPNPFDAYDGRPKTEPKKTTPDPVVVTPPLAPVVPGLFTQKGRLTLSLSNQLSLTSSNNDVPGGDVSDSTIFARFVPQLGYFIRDKWEIGGGAGLMLRRFGRQSDEGSTSTDWVFEAFTRYHISMGGRLWFVPAASLGVYTGSSTRTVALVTGGQVKNVDEETSTLGLSAVLRADVAYNLYNNLALRGGLNFNGVWGREYIESQDESFLGATYHMGFGFGVAYHFE